MHISNQSWAEHLFLASLGTPTHCCFRICSTRRNVHYALRHVFCQKKWLECWVQVMNDFSEVAIWAICRSSIVFDHALVRSMAQHGTQFGTWHRCTKPPSNTTTPSASTSVAPWVGNVEMSSARERYCISVTSCYIYHGSPGFGKWTQEDVMWFSLKTTNQV